LSSLSLQVSSIEKTREAYKAQFNIGQRSLLDLLDTENELLNARRTQVNSDIDLALAYFRTQAGIGRLLEYLGLKRIDEDESPDASELTPITETEICPPEAPKNYLVDLEALNRRAMDALDKREQERTAAAPWRPGAANSPELSVKPAPSALANAKSASSSGKPGISGPAVTSPVALPERIEPPAVAPMSKQVEKSIEQAINERVKAWAAAWSARDHSAYLSFYASSFVPADGSSRSAWEEQRVQRVSKPTSIQVDVKNLNVRKGTGATFESEFEQDYNSDAYSDSTLKNLRWISVNGQWLIERETSRSLPKKNDNQRKPAA
jgi:adhesin transport system outer membrane protein